jgi:GNAT superfamily N-acetyltransferase
MSSDLVIRRMEPGDGAAVQALMSAALGGDRSLDFFEWKHRANPFGESPAWLAMAGDRLAAFRTFLRWEFETPEGVVRAVRAVDTATHPDFQGKGLFTALTTRGLQELAPEGVRFVFNTPNAQSRPGYLKMGWQVVGRLPAGVLPRSLASLPRILSARAPAERASEPVEAGDPADQLLVDEPALVRLLASLPPTDGLATHRTVRYLRWRYGFGPLSYRAMLVRSAVEEGMILFRVRRRGGARELVVAELLLPRRSTHEARRIIHRALRATRADYALGLRTERGSGLFPLPWVGPPLTWRPLAPAGQPPLAAWKLSLGDIELF